MHYKRPGQSVNRLPCSKQGERLCRGFFAFPSVLVAFLLIASLYFLSLPAFADNIKSYRTEVGLKLFKTLVAADLNLHKKTSADGTIKIALLYVSDELQVRKLQTELSAEWSKVKQIPIKLELMTVEQFELEKPPVAAAILITEELLETEMKKVIEYSLAHKIVFFSPFEGDVESGVLAGLSVQATVRPLINRAALEKGGYDIKSFYLKVAKYYD